MPSSLSDAKAPTASSKDVLLVNFDWRDLDNPGRFRIGVPYFPLELLYVEGALQNKGVPSTLVDLWGQTHSREELNSMLPAAKVVVVTTAPTYIFWRDGVCGVDFPQREVARLRALAPDATFIAIGPQGTVMPGSMSAVDVDYVVRGEGELTAAELAYAALAGVLTEAETLPGVCPRIDGQVEVRPGHAYVADLDDLPALTFESLGTGTYGQVSYEASRGCPYACTFCCRDGFRGKLRTKSPVRIRVELEALKAHGYNHAALIDEIFGMNEKWLLSFCEITRALDLKWGIQTRSECLSPKRLEALASSGCVSIEIGLESADPEVSEAIGKKTDYEELAANVQTACELGVEQVRLMCIIGSPKETRASIARTRDFLFRFIDHDAVEADVFPMLPLPGTLLWEQAVRLGYPLKDWSDVHRYSGIVDNGFSDPAEVETIARHFAREWEYQRAKRHSPHGLAASMALSRMWLTVKFPSLIGLRHRLSMMLPNASIPR